MSRFPWANAQLVFHSSWSAPLVVMALVLAVGVSLFLNRPTRRLLGRPALLLLGLEGVCAALLVLWLVNPRLRYEKRAGGESEIAVAIDRSLSMETHDVPGDQSRYEAASDAVFASDNPLLRQLGEIGRVKTYTFASKLEEQAPGNFPPKADPAGYGTNLKGAIETLGRPGAGRRNSRPSYC